MMNICLVDFGDSKTGSTRIWIHTLKKYLSNIGCNAKVNDFSNLCDYDVCIMGKSVSLELFHEARKFENLLIGDINPSTITKSKFDKLQMSDFVIVGSIEERDYYLQYNKNAIIFPLIENVSLPEKQHKDNDRIVIGYHGNKMHLESLSHNFFSALESLGRNYNVELKCVYNFQELGKWQVHLCDVSVRHVQWKIDSWLEELSECDIGIAPGLIKLEGIWRKILRVLPGTSGFANDYIVRYKNTSNAGRCFVFHQLGIPVVAEMVPSNFHILGNPENGFLVYSEEGWYQALHQLSFSSEFRTKISQNASAEFRRQYDPLVWAQRLINNLSLLQRA